MKKVMDLIGDQEIKETMGRVWDNLDRTKRMKDERVNPADNKIRASQIRKLAEDGLKTRIEKDSSGIALILAGGGAKASYQVGACKVLMEHAADRLPADITGIAGTSAGALNAALLAGAGIEFMLQQWECIEEEGMNGTDGFFGPSEENDRYLEKLIRRSGVVSCITMDSPLTVVTAFDYNKAYPMDFILNTMSDEEKVNCLLASAAVPVAFRQRDIRGVKYIDGGIPVFGSNVPIAPMYYLGYRRFIVIHCASRREAAGLSGLGVLGIGLNREEYFNGASFVHLYPRRDMGGLVGGTINFNHEFIVDNIAAGCEDMYAALDEFGIFSEEVGAYDEVHVVDGERYRTYAEVLRNL